MRSLLAHFVHLLHFLLLRADEEEPHHHKEEDEREEAGEGARLFRLSGCVLSESGDGGKSHEKCREFHIEPCSIEVYCLIRDKDSNLDFRT